MARRISIAESARASYPDRDRTPALCECWPCSTRRQISDFSKGGVLTPGAQSEPPDVDRRVHSLDSRQEIIEVLEAVRHPQPAVAMANPERLAAKSTPDGLDGRDMDLLGIPPAPEVDLMDHEERTREAIGFHDDSPTRLEVGQSPILGLRMIDTSVGRTRSRPTGCWHRTDKSGKRECLRWQHKGLNVSCDAWRSGGIRT